MAASKDADVVVVDCEGGKYKDMSEEEREKVDKAFRSLMQDGHDRVVMLYAEWCNHCKQQMPSFVDAAKGGKEAKFTIGHAEAMHRSTFVRESGSMLIALEYFPTFLVKKCGAKTNKLYEVNLKQAEEFSKTGKVPEGAAEKAEVEQSKSAPVVEKEADESIEAAIEAAVDEVLPTPQDAAATEDVLSKLF